MSENKQVSIARHSVFYKIFFVKHSELLESFLELNYENIKKGYENLLVFYGSYAYWIKEDDKDNYIKDMMKNNLSVVEGDVEYNHISKKLSSKGINSLTYDQLEYLNNQYLSYFEDLLKVLEIITLRLAPSDMLPNLTSMHQEYDRQLAFVIYDAFYESLYRIHSRIIDKLMNFNILEFIAVYRNMLVFFYGYSYYVQKHTKTQIRNELNSLFEIYNNKNFLKPFFKLLQLETNKKDTHSLKDYREKLFNSLIYIFELVNQDLPKTNIFPKKQDKVLIDDTLI